MPAGKVRCERCACDLRMTQVKQAARHIAARPRVRRVRAVLGRPSTRRNLRDEEHLRLLFAFALSESANCIDVGANVGGILGQIVAAAPRGRHIAYEPLPELCADLLRRFPTVDVRQVAASDRRGTASFQHVRSRPAYSGLRRRDYPGHEDIQEIQVAVEDIDSSLPDGYVPSLIKIDVEGGERQVIEGAIETIVRHRPMVVFEHGKASAQHYGAKPGEVFDLLAGRADLRIFDLDGTGPYDRRGFEAVFSRGTHFNFVAHD